MHVSMLKRVPRQEDCYSDPATAGEESTALRQSVAEEEILRYAPDDNRRASRTNRDQALVTPWSVARCLQLGVRWPLAVLVV